jgi:AraC-like DNA-binding protein
MIVLRGLVAAAEEAGATRSAMLQALGMQPEQLEAPDARLSLADIYRACEVALDLTGDAAFGLRWTEHIMERGFGPVSHALAYAPTLRRGFELLTHFEPLLYDGESPHRVIEDGARCIVRRVGWAAPNARAQAFSSELILAGFMKLVRVYDVNAQPRRASFQHTAPAHADVYARIFGPNVQFEQPFSEVELDIGLLDQPSPHADATMQAALQHIAEQRMAALAQHTPFAVRVHKLIVERHPERTSMAAAAEALALSERTLRKQLSAERTSYRELEHKALETIATQLLQIEQRSIQEAAYEMGFSDASTFHRAFKRWTGKTPRALQARTMAR